MYQYSIPNMSKLNYKNNYEKSIKSRLEFIEISFIKI